MADEQQIVQDGQELSVEQAFTRMQELIKDMEREDVTLEQSFADYEEGMRLVKLATSKIDAVEQKVLQMNADGTLTDYE